jgi:hypothetical protein
MKTQPDLDQSITAWLVAEAPERSPERLLSVSRERIQATGQRRPWWPALKVPSTNPAIRLALGATAVVVVAIVGLTLLPGRQGIGPPTASPTPTPVASVVVPTASSQVVGRLPESGLITSGRYRFDRLSFYVYGLRPGTDPSVGEWTSSDRSAVLHHDSMPPDGAGFSSWQIASVFPDPCHWSTTAPVPVGPTVADLISAFEAQDRGGETVSSADTTVGGYGGMRIDLAVPADIDFADCDGGEYHAWTDPGGATRQNQGPGQHDVLSIIDVGGSVEVILADRYDATDELVRGELERMVSSVVFDAPANSSASP